MASKKNPEKAFSKVEEKEEDIGSIMVSDSMILKVRLVGKEYLDIRMWVESERYTGPTKKGIRIYLFDDIWTRFKELMEKVDKKYEEIA